MSKNLYIMVGAPASGKSYWLEENAKSPLIVSRDKIRFSWLKEGEDYFEHEDEVFEEYIATIQEYLWLDVEELHVYADATQINAISRYKLLSNVELDDVDVHVIYINSSEAQCIVNNLKREGLEHTPEEVIHDFFKRLNPPSFDEYEYKSIIEVKYNDR